MQAQKLDFVDDSTEYLGFDVGGQSYAVEIASVREIRGWTEPASMPNMKPWDLGVINLRGETLALIDLAAKLGLEEKPEINERSVIVVVEIADQTVGLLVDSVSNIIAPPADSISEPPPSAKSQDSNYVSALTLIDDKIIRILDLSDFVQALSGDEEIN